MNNSIKVNGKVVGYRCYQCNDIVQSMWGTTCNSCRSQNEHNKKLLQQAKEMEKQQIIDAGADQSKGSDETEGYICPHTKKQCDDECCVSAEDCHIQAGIGIIFDCEQETTSSQTENESKGSNETKQ
jgi:hypothetical protein